MAAPNRAALIGKAHRVLKQHYKPVLANGDRPLLEQMLYACCLENAPYDKAEKAFGHLSTSFFDWNEVRVSTVKELAEALRDLPNPMLAASNVKRLLQNVFESTYSFELEGLKKQNIGVGLKKLAKLQGATPFVVGFATQHALGGHAIPLDQGALDVLYIVGIATVAERAAGEVGGLERAIPKSKGEEFGSLLHQLASDFVASPHSPNVKSLLLAINSDAKDRFPKRGQKKELEAKPAETAADRKHAKGRREAAEGKKRAKPTAAEATSKRLAGKRDSAAVSKGKPKRAGSPSPARPGASGRKSPAKQLVKRKPR